MVKKTRHDSNEVKTDIKVQVVPRSSRNQIIVDENDVFKLKVTAPPVEGKANKGANTPTRGKRTTACATWEEHDEGSLVWTVQEAGDRLRISRQSAYELVRQGRIPAIRLGRRLAVPKAALRQMLEEGHWQR